MYYGPFAPWEHYPKKLSHAEVLEPLKVIERFFSSSSPAEQSNSLRRWYFFVTNDRHFKNKQKGMVALLYIYDDNLKLLEAMYLLLLSSKAKPEQMTAVSLEQLSFEKESWKHFPDNLSEKYLRRPFKAVESIFRHIPPQQYRNYLKEWLQAAFSHRSVDENLEVHEVTNVYENLLLLHSVAWLIYNRASINPAIYQTI